jgi:2-hydroxy-6-oxonona-2,4-dienedioate hydrolase
MPGYESPRVAALPTWEKGDEMETWYIPVGIFSAGLLTGVCVYLRYLGDVQAARKRSTEGSQMVETKGGRIEYGDAGDGAPVLLIHGAGGGYDQGLLLGDLLLGNRFRLIAPSRFGYQQSPIPEDSSLEAQADAFACLLDTLGIDRATVVAVSAGGLPGLTFARRYPERTAALVLIAAVSYTENATGKDRKKEARINRIIGSDFIYWLAIRAARSPLLSLLGVSKEVRNSLTPAEMAQADRFLEAMLPMSRRWNGVLLDQSRRMPPDVPREQINVPGLVIHARDDGLVDWSNGQHAAAIITGAEVMTLERGGHLLLGHHDAIRTRVAAFLAEATAQASRDPQL